MKMNSIKSRIQLVSQWLFTKGRLEAVMLFLTTFLSVPTKSRSSLMKMIKQLRRLIAKNGPVFAVAYLKECTRLLMQYLAGNKSLSDQSPRVSLSNGLPLIIPKYLRHLVRTGDLLTIRIVMTVFWLYRVVYVPVIPKLQTITAPWTGFNILSIVGFESFLPEFIPMLLSRIGGRLPTLGKPRFHFTIKSSPLGGFAALSAVGELVSLRMSKSPLFSFITEFEATWYGTNSIHWLSYLYIVLDRLLWKDLVSWASKLGPVTYGKLSPKEEAAGKLRVFAIVDYWTQFLLRPLHRYLFSILRLIPEDGTFDQEGSVRTFRKLLTDKGITQVYSFDLSAATDRLPIFLYQSILQSLFGSELSIRWKTLISFRSFSPSLILVQKYNVEDAPLMYSVGQPIGAYSSWAMLAFVHHALVQWAWVKAEGTFTWFEDYRILGDDVVIANEMVAQHYLAIMQDLGVEISIPKSLISDRGVSEFAKRIFGPEGEYSGIPWGLLSESLMTPPLLTTFTQWLYVRQYSFTGESVAAAYFQWYHGITSVSLKSKGVLDTCVKDLPSVLRAALMCLHLVDVNINEISNMGIARMWACLLFRVADLKFPQDLVDNRLSLGLRPWNVLRAGILSVLDHSANRVILELNPLTWIRAWLNTAKDSGGKPLSGASLVRRWFSNPIGWSPLAWCFYLRYFRLISSLCRAYLLVIRRVGLGALRRSWRQLRPAFLESFMELHGVTVTEPGLIGSIGKIRSFLPEGPHKWKDNEELAAANIRVDRMDKMSAALLKCFDMKRTASYSNLPKED